MNLAAVFLDRDGTIIEDTHYPKNPDEVALIPSAIEGLKLMREKGYLLFVISNPVSYTHLTLPTKRIV